MADPFASGPIATTLAWLIVIPALVYGIVSLLVFLVEKKDMARPFKVWLVLCLALLAPARYIFFQLIAGGIFAFQSFSAFLTIFILALYVPIVFGILYLIGIGIPLGLTLFILGDEEPPKAGRYIGAAISLPVACLLANWLFHLALPYAAMTVRWLPAEHVIKATNGPAAFVFDHVAAPYSPILLPAYFKLTPQDATAFRRCHVATLYLSRRQEARFVKKAYPAVYDLVTSESDQP